LPIVSLEIPLSLPTFDVCLTWHDRHSDDPAHQWLRTQIADAVRGVG
jgi:DNA-binding transcriptional LysR family regulator